MAKTADGTDLGWAVLDSLDSRTVVLDGSATIIATNAAWRAFAAGWDQATFGVGGNYLEVCRSCTLGDYGPEAEKGVTGVLDGSLPEFTMEFPVEPGIEGRWFKLRVRPLQRPEGAGAVVNLADVTTRRSAQEALLREHRRFTSLIAHTDALINVIDVDGTIAYKSPAFDSIVGPYRKGANDEFDVFALLHDDDVELFRRALTETAQSKHAELKREFRMRRGDGSWRWIGATFTNLLDDPDVGGILVSSRDITDRKEAETVLAHQAESFSTLFHATAEAMLIHDGKVVTAINQAYATLLGLEADQVVGRPILDFVAPNSHELVTERVRQGSETPYVVFARRGDGSTYFAEMLGRQIQYQGRALRLASVRDVTQQLAEEEALRASEARQALLVNLAKTLREMRDPDQMLSTASETLGRFLNTHRVWFFEMVDDALLIGTNGWTDGTLPPLSGALPIPALNYGYAPELRAGHTVRISDARKDAKMAATRMESAAIAGIAVPLQRGGQWNAGLFVGHATVREWSDDEVALARDVAELTWDAVERGQAEAALRAREARFRALVQQASDIVVVFNAVGGLVYASPGLERVLGHPLETYADELRVDLVHPADQSAVNRMWESVVATPGAGQRITFRVTTADGTWVWLETHVSNFLHVPEVGGMVINARDVTEQKRLESELRHLALHDPLTGLPNRTLLADRMEQALRQAALDGKRVGVLFVDLNGFKQVNDAFGHEAGDELLYAIGQRLRSTLQGAETVARLGGDEFVLLLPAIQDVRQVSTFAEQVRAAMTDPFTCRGGEVPIGVTIGVAVSEPGLLKPDILLRDGDAAMYRAKRAGRGQVLLHTSGMEENAMRRWRLRTDVAEAAARGQLEMHYQPIVALATGAVSGMEALLRWRHPVYGMVPPDEFIPLAEEAGQIVALGRWGLTQVCELLARWGPDSPPVSLNFSATQFSDPGLVSGIADQIAHSVIDPGKLRLEITEQIMIEDLAGTVATLTQLRQLGVSVAIDDFGSGYSSLRYLRELPVTDVKLDRSFMHDLENDLGGLAMISGIATIAHAIGLPVTAEGIETAGQLALLRGIGCDYGQGFHLGRPVPAPDVPPGHIDLSGSSPWVASLSGSSTDGQG